MTHVTIPEAQQRLPELLAAAQVMTSVRTNEKPLVLVTLSPLPGLREAIAGALERVATIRYLSEATEAERARMPDAWAARNCRQVGDARRGAGRSPAAARIRRIVPSPTRYPRPSISPWMRR